MTIELLQKARDLAGQATPLMADCGRHCHHACCKEDSDGQGGIYLFPGEEEFYKDVRWARVENARMLGHPAKILYCHGECPRENRPLGCRIFPLTPDFARGPQVRVRFDYRARPICPLMKSGLRGLSPAFIRGVEDALQVIASDAEGYDFLLQWEELEKQYDFHL